VKTWGYDAWRSDGWSFPDGPFIGASAGGSMSCLLDTGGAIECKSWKATDWGDYDQWVAPSGSFESISAGHVHSCGLKADGTVECWGANGDGQCDPPEGVLFKSVDAGFGSHSCGVTVDDSIECWGFDGRGATDAPVGTYKAVSAGEDYSCGITTDHQMKCWGLGGAGSSSWAPVDYGQADPPFVP
jgi:hypothetical protein